MKRKLLSVLLVLVMLFASFTQVSYAAFSDTTGHWAEQTIIKWSDMGLVKGYEGKFQPDNSISRADTAVILSRLFGYHMESSEKFSDVPANAYYAKAVHQAKAAGSMNGCSQTTFEPTNSLTREEAAVMMCNILDLQDATTCKMDFSDADKVSLWSKGKVNAMVNAGYMQGYAGLFNPQGKLTRAELLTILNNVFKHTISQGEFSDNVDGTVLVQAPATLKDMKINGDLIIGEGCNNGVVTLDNVKVTGRVIVRGADLIVLKNGTKIDTIYMERKDGETKVSAGDESDINQVVKPSGGESGHWEDVIDYEATKELLESALSESIKEEYPTVYIAIDCFTIGAEKFILAPVKEQVRPGTTVAQLLAKEWGEGNMKYTGKLSGSFYLHSISGIESGIIPNTLDIADLPECLAAAAGLILTDGMPKNNEDEDVLGEFDYTLQSGWMYSVNGHYPNVGMGDYPLEDGDVVRISFTLCGLGADIGGGYSAGGMSSANYYTYNHLTKEIKDCADGTGSLSDLITDARKLEK